MQAERPIDIKGCPWCRSRRLRQTGNCIECLSCGASGPEMKREDTRQDYIRRWNARTLDAAPSEPRAEHWRRAVERWYGSPFLEAIDELARLRAEVAENKREIDELVRAVNLGSERAKKAERERDELRRRIAEAPAFTLTWVDGREWRSHDVPDVAHADISGQRVALVRLDAEEGK